MENWDEVKSAFKVVEMGTVSGAAKVLDVHHATIIRHIDALEARLGVKLFQRHARGYTPTEAGQDLFRVAQSTQDQFAQLVGRLKGQGESVSGEIVVTALAESVDLLVPMIGSFQDMHPDVRVRLLVGERVYRLEYGEAHVALRAGGAPSEPDNVVQPFVMISAGLFAAPRYIETYGQPTSIEDLATHRFVTHDVINSRAPHYNWLAKHVPETALVLRSTDVHTLQDAVVAGLGIGFLERSIAHQLGMIEVIEPRAEWSSQLWLVTHVDLHRTIKVQALLAHLKDQVKKLERTA